jgi:peptidoglycan/LPS O-acetylase OafA/YrhL
VPGALDEFGFGIMLAMALYRDRDGRLRRLLHSTRWLWPCVAAVLATITMKLFWREAAFWENWALVVLWRTLLAATMFLVVVSACAINDPWFIKLTAPLRYLGTISYGIYLWHALVGMSLKPYLAGDPERACRWTVGLTFLLAVLSWHLVEKPVLDHFARRKRNHWAFGEPPNVPGRNDTKLNDEAPEQARSSSRSWRK